MEGNLLGLQDFIGGALADDVGQIHWVGAADSRNGLQLLDALGRGVSGNFLFAEFTEIVRCQVGIAEGSSSGHISSSKV